jgi:hypothetical protein
MSVDVGSRLTRCLMDWILMLFSGEMDEIMEGREEGAIGPLRMRFGLRDGHGKAVAPVDDRQWLSLGCHWDVNGMPAVANLEDWLGISQSRFRVIRRASPNGKKQGAAGRNTAVVASDGQWWRVPGGACGRSRDMV